VSESGLWYESSARWKFSKFGDFNNPPMTRCEFIARQTLSFFLNYFIMAEEKMFW